MENSLSTPYNLSIDLHIETLASELSYKLLKLLNPLALKHGFINLKTGF